MLLGIFYCFAYGFGGEIQLGETEEVEAGMMAEPTHKAIIERIGTDSCSLGDVTDIVDGVLTVTNPSCPRIVIVPFTNALPNNPSGNCTITGFGIFFINSVIVTSEHGKSQAEVEGQFIEQMIIQSTGEITEFYGGIKVLRLID